MHLKFVQHVRVRVRAIFFYLFEQKTGNAIRALGRMAILSANSRRNLSAASSPTKTSFDDDLFSDVTANGMGFKPIKPVVIIEDRTVSEVFEKSSESVDLEEDEHEPEPADLPDHEPTINDDFSNGISIDDHLTVTEIDDVENCENNQIENDSPLIQEIDDFSQNDESTLESCNTCIEEISSQVFIDENELVTELHFEETSTSLFTENSRKQSFSSFVNLEISDNGSADIDQENQLLQTRESEETSIREIEQYEQKTELDNPEITPFHINLENLDENTETSPRTPVVTKVWCKNNNSSLVGVCRGNFCFLNPNLDLLSRTLCSPVFFFTRFFFLINIFQSIPQFFYQTNSNRTNFWQNIR